jgi:hypothetical protein
VSLLLMLLLAVPANALHVEARVDRDKIRLSDQIYLTLTITSASPISKPRMPSMPKFSIYDVGQSETMTYINGKMTKGAEYRFVLGPRSVGKAVIPAISVRSGSEIATTQAIPITILRPNATPPPAKPRRRTKAAPKRKAAALGPEIFIDSKVDRKRPYVNEQVILTVRFHTAVPLAGNARWEPPNTTGFLAESLPPSPHRKVKKNGRVYFVSEVNMALFALQTGKLTIGPSTVRCQIPERAAVDPFAPDFMQQFFSAGLMPARVRELKTKPLALTARPLPSEGKPTNYSGAVGSYTISAETDGRQFKVGDAINLSVTIEGRGNLKGFKDPELPKMDELRAYETVSDLNLLKSGTGISGKKVFKTVLVPRVSGPATIPAIPFAYFDPKKGKYITIKSNPIALQIDAGAVQQAPVGFQSQGRTGAEITELTTDIRHIKSSFDEPLLRGMSAWIAGTLLLHAVPSLLFICAMGYSLYRQKLLQDPVGMRARKALNTAKAKITRAKNASDSGVQTTLLADALTGYISDKVNRPASGLTLRDAQEALSQRFPKIPPGHLTQLKNVWEEIDLMRFAPAGAVDDSAEDLGSNLRELLVALEEASQ